MGIFSGKSGNSFLSNQQIETVKDAIGIQEKRTSGEIRVYIENRCRFIDPVDRAIELFNELQMHQTRQRNAVLLYIAFKDRQIAILGDIGIHEILGKPFWDAEVQKMVQEFGKGLFAEGILKIVEDIGNALYIHFPYDEEKDTNELSDDIIFGK